MRQFRGVSVGVFGLCVAAAGVQQARAQEPRAVYTWAGGGVAVARAGAWGNGEATVTREPGFDTQEVLRVTTRSLQEGARFDFATPVDLTPYQQNGYWRLRLRFGMGGMMGGRGGMMGGMGGMMGRGGMMGGMMGGMGGMMPGMGGPGMPGGEGLPGEPGGPGGAEPLALNPNLPNSLPLVVQAPGGPQTQVRTAAQMGSPGAGGMMGGRGGMMGGMGGPMGMGGFPGMMGGRMGGGMRQRMEPPLTQIQLIVMREQGAMFGRINVDFRASRPDAQGWQTFLIPLRDMRPTPDAGGRATRVILTGDREATFSLDQLALVVETEKMSVSIRQPDKPPGTQLGEITVGPGRISLVADVEAGISDTVVEWNFDADNTGALPPPLLGAMEGEDDQGNLPGGGAEGADGDAAMGGMVPGAPARPGVGPGMMPGGVLPDGGAVPDMTGPRVDARGLAARFTYPNEEQNYRVEVTVRDRAGKKATVKSSILVKVRA